MRLFVGIPLPARLIAELSAVSAQLQSTGGGLRWSAPETWHVTLQFLGNTSPEQYACVNERLGGLHAARVPVELEGVGFFDHSGICFVGVHLTPELVSLQHKVTETTSPCGFVPETRPYRPHITLARAKGKTGGHSLRELKKKTIEQPGFSKFVAEEFAVYESFTQPTGSRYEIRERYLLVGRS